MIDFPQIAPMLSYEDVAGAADWLVRAFGFEDGPVGRRYRGEDPEGHRWMFAQA